MKRIFIIVLDSFGIGSMPDSESFGDVNVNTLRSCEATGKLNIPNMIAAGLGNIDGVECLPKADAAGVCPLELCETLTEAVSGVRSVLHYVRGAPYVGDAGLFLECQDCKGIFEGRDAVVNTV